MGLRLRGQQYSECLFLTTSFQARRRLGNHSGVYESIAESLSIQLDKRSAKLISFVLMPSHFHLVLAGEDGLDAGGLIRDVKKYTAQQSLEKYAVNGQLWQSRYDRVAIWSRPVLLTKVNYCHLNPVRAGLAQEPEEWFWSSAADYMGIRSGPLRVWKDWQ